METSGINLDNIKRSSKNFSFVDTLGSFINNYEFGSGYREFQNGNDNKYSYIWNALSAIGNDYAETIYENVLNYIDNAANVDLCKIRALRSMIKNLGIRYDIIDDITSMPIELLNLMDILSINRKYLINNTTFCSAFMHELSTYDTHGVFISSDTPNTLSNDLRNASDVSSFNVVSSYIDDSKYKLFLNDVYYKLLLKFIKLQYCDAELGLSTEHTYIYEYISEQLIGNYNTTDRESQTSQYDNEIAMLKLQYGISEFDQNSVVDDIENGYDTFDKHSEYEQQIIEAEIKRRESTYSSGNKVYDDYQDFLGFQITRFSYYREKKVKEYFNFVESTYNTLITAADVENAVANSSQTKIQIYDKNINYFHINDSTQTLLLSYDNVDKQYILQTTYIKTIAELLATQTLEIADIRDQIKVQMRKTYLKGTFMLLSYIINEYLKLNIVKNYGEVFNINETQTLGDILTDSMNNSDGDNVEIIEYFDKTEYFNISTEYDAIITNDPHVSVDFTDVNSRYWDNDDSKLGVITHDIPLEEIDEYYRNTLQLNVRGAKLSSDLMNFLSIIYEYGATTAVKSVNNTIIDKFTFSDGTYAIIDATNLSDDTYESWKKTYDNKILNAVTEYQTNTLNELGDFQTTLDDIQQQFNDARSCYYVKRINDRFNSYGLSCTMISGQMEWFRNKVMNYNNFEVPEISNALKFVLTSYYDTADRLSSLVDLSVHKTYWPMYPDDVTTELTDRTYDLKLYLNAQIISKQQMLAHVTEHLNKLISYKDSISGIRQQYLNGLAIYKSIYDGLEAATNTRLSKDKRVQGYAYIDSAPIYKYKFNKETEEYEINGHVNACLTSISDPYYSPGISDSDTLDEKLSKLALRSHLPVYKGFGYVTALLESDESGLEGVRFSTHKKHEYEPEKGITCYYYSFKYKTGQVLVYETKEEPYSSAYSESAAADVKKSIDDAIDQFYGTDDKMGLITLVDAELDCLDSDKYEKLSEIITSRPTYDTIEDDLNTMYDTLIGYIYDIQTLINEEQLIETDKNIVLQNRKNQQISAIVFADPTPNNIRYINLCCENIALSLDNIFNDNLEYFNGYSPDTSKLISQQISATLLETVKINHGYQDAISAELDKISPKMNAFLSDMKSKLLTYKYYQIMSLNDLLDYNCSEFQISSAFAPDVFTNIIDKDNGTKIYGDKLLAIIKSTLEWQYGGENNKDKQLSSIIVERTILDETPNDTMCTIQYPDSLNSQLAKYKQRLTEICEKLNHIKTNKELFLKYHGSEIGYDPYANIKNQTHSSYQIHPYLYNFVEKSNTAYPLANTFFVAFSEDYENKLIAIGIDNIIGKFGNQINLLNNDIPLWNGTQSLYEYKQHQITVNSTNPLIGFSGAFYPDALKAYLDDPETFRQDVQDNLSTSWYYHLALTQEECNKIAEQLRIYERPIREIVQALTDDASFNPNRQNEYDIYKYAEDLYGNSLILFKSYKYLYEQHSSDPNYEPSYSEKKNTPGELWMRIKNHPLAFPAFDLRPSALDYSQFNIEATNTQKGKAIQPYIIAINNFFCNTELVDTKIYELTQDSIGRTATDEHHKKLQHLRCWFDMELGCSNNDALLLTVPYQTGSDYENKNSTRQLIDNFTYKNCDVIIGQTSYIFDAGNNVHIYSYSTFQNSNDAKNVVNNFMSASRPSGIQIIGSSIIDEYGNIKQNIRPQEIYDFIGFAKNTGYIYALFVHKYYIGYTGQNNIVNSFSNPLYNLKKEPILKIYSVAFNGSLCYKKTTSVPLTYDIYYNAAGYVNDNNIVMSYNNKYLTIAYVSEETQQEIDPILGIKTYNDNVSVVNYVEYTKMVDDRGDLSVYGSNVQYPANTALLQTKDDRHINIYNSFDSFTSHIVTVELKFNSHSLRFNALRHYNLNSDIGYIPLFSDTTGKSRFQNNSTLALQTSYNCELVGPENSDVEFTPTLLNSSDDAGTARVTEDWKDIDTRSGFTNAIQFNAGDEVVTSYIDLLDVFGKSSYNDLAENGELTTYAYTFTNTSYENVPIAKGTLRDKYPTNYNYLSSEKYDTLSGEEVIGPNGVTYHGLNQSNHIDNVKKINLEVIYDENQQPRNINISCYLRQKMSESLILPDHKFRLLVYAKKSNNPLKYYHLFENANKNASHVISGNMGYDINFNSISSLSTYTINGIYPFKNYGPDEFSKMSAILEFKYSDENKINQEFPSLKSDQIQDDVVILNNENQYIYFHSLDSFDTIEHQIFYSNVFDPTLNSVGGYVNMKINTSNDKYSAFFNNALMIETTYNVEDLTSDKTVHNYGLVLYFNYKNYTNPQYIKFTPHSGTVPPTYTVYTSTDKAIENTYLRLEPGKSGRLDIRVEFLYCAKLKQTDLNQSIVGCAPIIIQSYYIMNVSDDKPKFIISRKPFTDDTITDKFTYKFGPSYPSIPEWMMCNVVIYSDQTKTQIISNQQIRYGSSVILPSIQPTKSEYTFKGWSVPEINLNNVTYDMDVFAVFEPNFTPTDKWIVNFYVDSTKQVLYESYSVYDGDALDVPHTCTYEKPGYSFDKWNYTNTELTHVHMNINAYGIWSKDSYKINVFVISYKDDDYRTVLHAYDNDDNEVRIYTTSSPSTTCIFDSDIITKLKMTAESQNVVVAVYNKNNSCIKLMQRKLNEQKEFNITDGIVFRDISIIRVMKFNDDADLSFIGHVPYYDPGEIKRYTEVEYIESSGTQWLDLEIVPTINTISQFKFIPLNITGGVIFGGCGFNDTDDYRFFNHQGGMLFDFGGSFGIGNRIGLNGGCAIGQLKEIEIGNFYGKDLMSGNIIGQGSKVSTYTTAHTLKWNYSTNAQTVDAWNKLYYIKISDGSRLLLNLIPVIDENNRACMYDTLLNRFYYNKGTGEFKAGPYK